MPVLPVPRRRILVAFGLLPLLSACVPAVIAMFCGALMISALPWLATWLPGMLLK